MWPDTMEQKTKLQRHTLGKHERLCSLLAIEELFQGGHRLMAAYPIRVVYMPVETPGIRILVSVSKRHFKRAVLRNRVKRQIREAYRLNKSILEPLQEKGMHIAFLWLSRELFPTKVVAAKIQNLLQRIYEENC